MKYLQVFSLVLCLLVVCAPHVGKAYKKFCSSRKVGIIATAASKSFADPYRKLRDKHLEPDAVDPRLVQPNYRTSPPGTELIAHPKIFRAVTRWVLAPLVYGILYPRVVMLLLVTATMGLAVLLVTGFIRKKYVQ
jgi:hypothetical protein